MTDSAPPTPAVSASALTLFLCTLLHAFIHVYSVLLVPIYLLIASDLKLGGIKQAAMVVTVYSVVYWGLAFVSGMLADRYNRKALLGLGLLGNAAAVLGTPWRTRGHSPQGAALVREEVKPQRHRGTEAGLTCRTALQIGHFRLRGV